MSKIPVLLLLESSTSVCSVAISYGDQLLAVKETTEGNKHSRWMTIFIQEALQQANKTYDDIDAIAVSAGPGSYTGLRVAYSIAKGIAYSRDLPIIEINTLDALSDAYIANNSLYNKELVIPMLDARRMEVYWHHKDCIGNIMLLMEAHILDEQSFNDCDDYNQLILLGDGAPKVKNLTFSKEIHDKLLFVDMVCSAKHLRFEANKKWQDKLFSDVAYCNPTYLKSPNITKSKKNILS